MDSGGLNSLIPHDPTLIKEPREFFRDSNAAMFSTGAADSQSEIFAAFGKETRCHSFKEGLVLCEEVLNVFGTQHTLRDRRI